MSAGGQPSDGLPMGGFPKDPESFEAFLADVYAQLPALIVRMSADGMVLSVNPAVVEVTGYGPSELLGRNWWGMLFPGKLFAQVPKFISPTSTAGLLRDYPMTLRRKDGRERVVAWSRFQRELEHGRQEIVCVGLDLTDRLIKADLVDQQEIGPDVQVGSGEATTVGPEAPEGDFVMPLAISPPAVGSADGTARTIQEIHEFLLRIDAQAAAMESAFAHGEVRKVEELAETVGLGARACGLLDVTIAAEQVHAAAMEGAMETVGRQVEGLLELCRRSGRGSAQGGGKPGGKS